MTKVWLIGSSHTAAILRAQNDFHSERDDLDAVLLGPSTVVQKKFHKIKNGNVEFTNEGYQKNSVRFRKSINAGKADTVGVYLGDTIRILFLSSSYWQSHEPSIIATGDRAPVPDSTIRAFIESDSRAVCEFLSDLKDLGKRVYWITYPAIKSNHHMFEEGVRKEVAKYIDGLFIEHMTNVLSAKGISTIGRPRESLTQEGFLKEKYSQDITSEGNIDKLHANSQYGELMRNEIRLATRAGR